jgi:hypothetical protein
VRLSVGAANGCSAEQCSQCVGNSTCIGSMSGNQQTCICPPGLRGANCDQCEYLHLKYCLGHLRRYQVHILVRKQFFCSFNFHFEYIGMLFPLFFYGKTVLYILNQWFRCIEVPYQAHLLRVRFKYCIFSVTTVKELTTASSFAEWSFQQPSYNTTVNSTSQKNVELSVMFRTRQTNGIIFFASSFSKLEQAVMEVIV